MDIQLAFICGIIFVITVALSLFIAHIGIKQKSYEEALAEQRDLSAGLLGSKAQAKQQAKDKKLKKLNKKNKKQLAALQSAKIESNLENVSTADGNNLKTPKIVIKQSSTTHVEFNEKPAIIPTDMGVVKINRKSKKDKLMDVKPILLNREPSPVLTGASKSNLMELNHFEQIHPKDEKELLKSHMMEKNDGNKRKKIKSKDNVESVVDKKVENNKKEVLSTKTVEKKNEKINTKHNSNEIITKKENIQEKSKKNQEKVNKQDVIKTEKQKKDTNKNELKKEGEIKKDTKKNEIKKDPTKNETKKEKNKNEKVEIEKKKVNQVGGKEINNKKTIDKNLTVKNSNENVKKVVANKSVAKNTNKKDSEDKIKKDQTNTDNKSVQNNDKKLKDTVEQKAKKNLKELNGGGSGDNKKTVSQPQSPPPAVIEKNKKNKKELLLVNGTNENEKHDKTKEIVEKIQSKTVQLNGNINTLKLNNNQNVVTQILSAKETKKRKRELHALHQMSGDNTSSVNVSLLVPLISKAELSRSEVQILIDLLLNKQLEAPIAQEWFEGRSDPVVKLKKQLAERERCLEAEQEAHAGVAAKLREVRSELNSCIQSKRQIEEANAQALNERAQLIQRLQHNQEHLQAEKQMFQKQIQQLQSKMNEERHTTRQFQEEHVKLQQQRQQLDLAVSRLSEQHKENETALKNKIGSLHNDLQEQINVGNSLRMDLHTVRTESEMLRERVAHLQTTADQAQEFARQLEESRLTIGELEKRLQLTVNNAQSMTEKITLLEEAKNKTSVELQNLQAELVRAQNVLKQKQDENEQIATQLKRELSAAQAQITAASAEDNKAKQVEILNLHNELNSTRAELKATRDEIEKQKQKNNDIRQLNWKVMEALNAAEKNNQDACIMLNENVAKARLEEQENNRKFLQRLFPEIVINSNVSNEKFLNDFEKAVSDFVSQKVLNLQLKFDKSIQQLKENHTQQLKQLETDYNEKLMTVENKLQLIQTSIDDKQTNGNESSEEITRLQEAVVRYKNIIADTESMLNKLEENVAKEERKWKAILYSKDEEISHLKTQLLKFETEQISELNKKLNLKEKENQTLMENCEKLNKVVSNNHKDRKLESNKLMNHEKLNQQKNDENNSSTSPSFDSV